MRSKAVNLVSRSDTLRTKGHVTLTTLNMRIKPRESRVCRSISLSIELDTIRHMCTQMMGKGAQDKT